MASKALKKQICYAAGTLGGWLLAKATNAKETVPYTILGGLAGFAVSENVFGVDKTVMVKPYVADKKKDDELSGTKRRRKSKTGTKRRK